MPLITHYCSTIFYSSWTTLSTLRVTFGSLGGQIIAPQAGDSVGVIGGLIRASCRPNTICQNNYVLQSLSSHRDDSGVSDVFNAHILSGSSVLVEPPLEGLMPILNLITPTHLGACNNLTVDLSTSSGNGGRSWSKIRWSVVATLGSTKGIEETLKAVYDVTANIAIVPRSLLIDGIYVITVTVTNFLGSTATASSNTVVSGAVILLFQPYFLVLLLCL